MTLKDSQKLTLVSGVSGSGISTVMSILEDEGYRCIERIPIGLLPYLSFSLIEEGAKKIALSVDIENFLSVYDILKKHFNVKLILLTADKKEIKNRYNLTKHIHPNIIKNKALTLNDAIDLDFENYNKIPQLENLIYINTSEYNQQELKPFVIDNEKEKLDIVFQAFGYKKGIPEDADLVFDVRFLPNPFWVKELKNMNGNNEEVYKYVIESEKAKEYLPYLINFLNITFKNYEKENRKHIVIAIGCTGGQHRSLSVVNYLIEHYKNLYKCHKKTY